MAILKRGNKYGVRVWAQGRHQWLGTFATLKEARKAEAAATVRPTASGSMTVEQWSRLWLAEYAREAPATQRTYRYATAQIVADIGSQPLDLSRPEAKALANKWPRNTTRVARTMWADALRDGLAAHNPFTNLRLETPKGRKDITALTEPEIARLADIARDVSGDYGDESAAIILFAAYSGLRPGELAALEWADLNIPEREATISRALDGQGGIKAPKNGQARTITLPPQALKALSLVARRVDSPLVFHTRRGQPLNKGTLNYWWRPVCSAWQQAGGRDLDLYELRHACATLLMERGATPADVAVQLGHTDGGRLAMILYGHPDQALARDRLRMAFAADGHKQGTGDPRLGHNSATGT